MKTQRIPIRAAKFVAEEFNLDQVILLAFSKTTGQTHVVTYGKTVADCEQAAQGGNRMKRALGWPEELCNAVPARARKAKKA